MPEKESLPTGKIPVGFSLGTRNTLSLFNEMPEEGMGVGIGGQFR